MPRILLRGSILGKLLLVAACMFLFAALHAPVALAQRVTGRIGLGRRIAAPHFYVPPASPSMFSRPRILGPSPAARVDARGLGFGPHLGFPFRRFPFFGSPLIAYQAAWWTPSYWWLSCGMFWSWEFDCYGLPLYVYGYGSVPQNYVALPTYGYPPYAFGVEGRAERDLIELFLKDGTVFNVIDYWFVNNELHFTLIEEGDTKPTEQVVDSDDLDVQKTIDVNTHRGFRVVMRNEPWEQYLRDHPDLTPPDLTPPQKN
jgi:hypothetical protein